MFEEGARGNSPLFLFLSYNNKTLKLIIMETNFLGQLFEITSQAVLFIEKNITEGKEVVLLEYDEDNEDEMYDLPCVEKVGKYGDYSEYAILSVCKKDGAIVLKTIDKGENRTKGTSTMEDLSSATKAWLADEISKKL